MRILAAGSILVTFDACAEVSVGLASYLRLSIAWLLTWMPSAVLAQEAIFEYGGWPGEGGPVLIAKRSDLVIQARPDLRSPAKRISYQRGWLLVDKDQVLFGPREF